jgi:cyanophycinase
MENQMKGLIALVGAGEYLPVMDDVDHYLLASINASGRAPRVVCLPTAAGQEGDESVGRWLRMGEDHFRALGADVAAVHIIDRTSADDPQYYSILESADLIYFSGGNPNYLYQTMNGSRAWAAATKAWEGGAVYAGCSAGAMILARQIPNFRMPGSGNVPGFGVMPVNYVIPHFDHIPGPFKVMVSLIRGRMKPGDLALGVDEDTALVGKLGGDWKVMGKSKVHLLTRKSSKSFAAGETVPLP